MLQTNDVFPSLNYACAGGGDIHLLGAGQRSVVRRLVGGLYARTGRG